MKRIQRILLASLVIFTGCGGDTVIPPAEVDAGSVTTQIGADLITPQYFEFDNKIGELVKCIGDFDLDRTQANLDHARSSWRDAHAAWERTEAFVFGPAAVADLTANLDSFPVIPSEVEEKLQFTPVFSKDAVFAFSGPFKGFHLIEYLLWDSAGTKTLSDFTPKEFEYMRAVASDMWRQSANIRYAWDPNRNDYNKQIKNAGQGGSEFSSSKEVLKTMLVAMAEACRDLSERKLGIPLSMGARFEESHFSGNSAEDYYNTLIGVRNVYQGGVEATGYSIKALIRDKDFLLDDRIWQELTLALDKVSALRPSFAMSLQNNRDAVIAAQTAVRTLEHSLTTDALIITQ